MSIFEKPLAIAMLLVGILIILEEIEVFTLNLPIDKVFIGAILIIALQLINVILLRTQNGTITIMNVVTSIVLIVPAAIYIVSSIFGIFSIVNISLIIGVMMFVEALYALHWKNDKNYMVVPVLKWMLIWNLRVTEWGHLIEDFKNNDLVYG